MQQPEEKDENPPQQPQRGLFKRIGESLFSQKHFRFKLLSGTTVGALVILLLAGTFFYVTLTNHNRETARSRTVEIIRLSSLVENDVAALETGHRGFLLTGDQGYVVSFERRRDQIRRRLGELGKLINKNDRQAKRLTLSSTVGSEAWNSRDLKSRPH